VPPACASQTFNYQLPLRFPSGLGYGLVYALRWGCCPSFEVRIPERLPVMAMLTMMMMMMRMMMMTVIVIIKITIFIII
jgi:hypothetical protein